MPLCIFVQSRKKLRNMAVADMHIIYLEKSENYLFTCISNNPGKNFIIPETYLANTFSIFYSIYLLAFTFEF